MCPVCIASTAVLIAEAASTGGVLAVCVSKFRKVLRTKSGARLGTAQNKCDDSRAAPRAEVPFLGSRHAFAPFGLLQITKEK